MDAIYIVGAGGIGCAVGYALAQAGAPVTFVERSPAKLAWCRERGVRLNRLPAIRVPIIAFNDWQPGPGSIVLLCVKCYDNPDVLARLPERVYLLPIQNGCDPCLEFHPPRAEGVVSFVSRCRPNRSHAIITRRGRLYLGINGQINDRLSDLASILTTLLRHAPFPVSLVEDIRAVKYSRLLYDATFCPIAAAGGMSNGEVLLQPRTRELFLELLDENLAILSGMGIKLQPIHSLPSISALRLLARPWLARAFGWLFARYLRGSYCPLTDDLHTGRIEIAYYNGHLVTQAGSVPCPINRVLLALTGRMIARHLPPHADRINEIWSAARATSTGSVILLPDRGIAG